MFLDIGNLNLIHLLIIISCRFLSWQFSAWYHTNTNPFSNNKIWLGNRISVVRFNYLTVPWRYPVFCFGKPKCCWEKDCWWWYNQFCQCGPYLLIATLIGDRRLLFSPLNTTHIKTVSSLLVKRDDYLQNLTFSFPINIPQIETLFIWLPFPKKCERGRVFVFIPLQEGERALWVCTHAVSPEKKLILRNDPWALYGWPLCLFEPS